MAAGQLSYAATDLRTARLVNGYSYRHSYVVSCGMIFAAPDFAVSNSTTDTEKLQLGWCLYT